MTGVGMRALFCLVAVLLAASPAAAEVLHASDSGFEIQHTVQLTRPTDRAWAALGQIGGWWDGEHTYSGDAANLSLSIAPGGCFCERFPDGGGIEHMRVTYVQPGERLVLTGPLGPLLFEAVAAVMDIKVERIAGGSRVTMNYRAAGFANGGAAKTAALVDQVLGAQMRRYRTFVAAQPRS